MKFAHDLVRQDGIAIDHNEANAELWDKGRHNNSQQCSNAELWYKKRHNNSPRCQSWVYDNVGFLHFISVKFHSIINRIMFK